MAAKQDISDDEGVISIREALQAEEILEEETAAVLGDADDNNCTYSKVNLLLIVVMNWLKQQSFELIMILFHNFIIVVALTRSLLCE